MSQFRLERTDEGIMLSAQLQFELSAAVEDALLKGVTIVFVMSAEVTSSRWYWFYDKKVSKTERYLRLAYQPLTRRWRVNVSSGPDASTPVGQTLNQNYDNLAAALAAIKRVSRWRVADLGDVSGSGKYRLEYQFQLDTTQIPRLLQIGAIGQSDWDIAASTSAAIPTEGSK